MEITVRELDELSQAWTTSELNGDVDALETLLTDDFIGVGPLGFLLTKEQWLMRYRSGNLRFETFDFSEVHWRIYGDAAIAVGRQSQVGAHLGQDVRAELRLTLIWVRMDQRWRIAGAQMSPIAAGGPPQAAPA